VSGKRERIADFLARFGLVDAIMQVRSRLPAPLSVITYHSVAEAASPGFDQDVVDATPAQFAAQLDFVSRFYSVIDIAVLQEALDGGRPLPPNPLLITFDDGYLSCHDNALPMLLERGLVGTFFVATDYIDQRRIYWWDRINYLVNNARTTWVEVGGQRYDLSDRAATIAELIAVVKRTPSIDLDAFLEELTRACDAPWTDTIERELADRVIMTWDQVRALRRAGMDVQSHTRSHRVLQTVPVDELDGELRGSRELLEEQLDEPITALAYPVGHRIVHDAPIRQAVERAGYRLGFTNQSGVNYRRDRIDRYDIRRLATDRATSMAMFAGTMAIPPLAFTREERAT
jgi:peptidoglycan/xylan/chitin deacetylase (PgdA/CDA1 family)